MYCDIEYSLSSSAVRMTALPQRRAVPADIDELIPDRIWRFANAALAPLVAPG